MSTSALTADRRHVLQRRIRWIVAVTIGYNLVEAVVAIAAGSAASSRALIAFGLDSTIEVLSAAAVAWQFTRRDPAQWEKPTLRVIAIAFFALAAYVITTSLLALFARIEPHSTPRRLQQPDETEFIRANSTPRTWRSTTDLWINPFRRLLRRQHQQLPCTFFTWRECPEVGASIAHCRQ